MAFDRQAGFKLDELNQKADRLRAIPVSIQQCTARIAEYQQSIGNLAAPITEAGAENKLAAEKAKGIVEPGLGIKILAFCFDGESRRQLAAIKKNNQQLVTQKEEKGAVVSTLAQQASAVQAQIQTQAIQRNKLETELAELNSISLVLEPKKCRDSLVEKLTSFSRNFEKHHPARQSVYVRRCLANMQEKIQQITAKTLEVKNEEVHARQQYFQLRGMILTMLQSRELQSEKNRNDQAFQDELMQAMRDFDASIDEINSVEAIAQYRDFTNDHPEIDTEILREREKADFDAVQAELRSLVEGMEQAIKAKSLIDSDFINLHDHSANLLNTFTHLNQECQRGNLPDFDRKFRTAILRTTVELLRGRLHASGENTLASRDAYDQYQIYLQQEKLGSSSTGKKFWGVMFMFLGAVMIGVSIAAKVTTMGLSTPASTWVLLGGIGVFGAGLALFKGGMQKGPSKSIDKVAKLTNDGQVRFKLNHLGILKPKNHVMASAWTAPSAPAEEKPAEPPSYSEVVGLN